MRLKHLLLLCFIPLSIARAGEPAVFDWSIRATLDDVYREVYARLEAHRLFVVFEPDIGGNLARFADRWGEDYNRNGLEGIRAMVFCNAWYANAVSNADPRMLALCPMHLTLTHKAGVTHVLYVNPVHVAKDTPAESVVREVVTEVRQAVMEAFSGIGRTKGD